MDATSRPSSFQCTVYTYESSGAPSWTRRSACSSVAHTHGQWRPSTMVWLCGRLLSCTKGHDECDGRRSAVVVIDGTGRVQAVQELANDITETESAAAALCVARAPIEECIVQCDATGREEVHVVDLRAFTVLPGLIDCHVHPFIHGEDYQLLHLYASSAAKALRGLRVVQRLLRAGWTSLRVAGDADVGYAAMDLARSIASGEHFGPTIVGAAHYLTVTGGGGDNQRLAPEQCACVPDGRVVDGVEEMRKAVREEVKYGATWIKLLATGAYMSARDNPERTHFSGEELSMCCVEAERWGVPVMAHAHGAHGIAACIAAGVKSIEHGTFITRESADAMARAGLFLVPTLYIGDHFSTQVPADPDGSLQKMVELERKHRTRNRACIRVAVECGVQVCCGSDYVGWDDVFLNARELTCLVEVGLTHRGAILSATEVAARCCGLDDHYGTITAGKFADAVCVPLECGTPDADVAVLSRRECIAHVFKHGTLVPDWF